MFPTCSSASRPPKTEEAFDVETINRTRGSLPASTPSLHPAMLPVQRQCSIQATGGKRPPGSNCSLLFSTLCAHSVQPNSGRSGKHCLEPVVVAVTQDPSALPQQQAGHSQNFRSVLPPRRHKANRREQSLLSRLSLSLCLFVSIIYSRVGELLTDKFTACLSCPACGRDPARNTAVCVRDVVSSGDDFAHDGGESHS